MSQPASTYLQTQILTATPQRLRLMLLEAAIRDADLTAQLWADEKYEQALEALIRCRDIVSELIAGIRPDASPLAQKVLGLYVFLFQALTEAQLSRDRQKLALVRRVLESERQTWQQVCQEQIDSPASQFAPQAGEMIAPALVAGDRTAGGSSQLSLEA